MTKSLSRNAVFGTVIGLTLASCTRRSGPAGAPASFATPDDAVDALVKTVERNDLGALYRLLGAGSEAIVNSGDTVADRAARQAFVERYHEHHQLVAGSPDDLALWVGHDDWPLPIPLERSDNRWHWDAAAAANEILARRIGSNELQTIDVMHGLVAAEEDYAAQGHDGRPAGIYAQRLRSEPGKHNGLYWEVAAGEPPSPGGPFLANATAEGYAPGQPPGAPYHGYIYRLLLGQGPHADGGAREYVRRGQLIGGFAAIARPAEYGKSGIMTFIVNQDGTVWQKDLGPDTGELAGAIRQFDPDTTWAPIPPEQETGP
ncbi:MAG TPA: DUF2950 domain-containing protein [Gemmatimonadales bacterium]|nr:DUF2950 domain-containing protein [Gemmatimonadales bacterium]